MILGKLIPRYSHLPRTLRVLATLGSGLLALLLLSFLLLMIFTLWINNTERGQAWLGQMLTGISPASGVAMDISGLRATGPAHITLGRLEARYKDQAFLRIENAALSFSLATLVERQPVVAVAIDKVDINTDVLSTLPATDNAKPAFQTPDIATLPFDSLRVSSAHIESLRVTSSGSAAVYAPRLTALLLRDDATLDIEASLEDTAQNLGRLHLAASLQSGNDLAVYLHRLSYAAPDISAVFTGQAHWPDFQAHDKIIGLISGEALEENGIDTVYLDAPLQWPIPLTLTTQQNSKPVVLSAQLDRASPFLDLNLPSIDWDAFSLLDISVQIRDDGWQAKGLEKNSGVKLSVDANNTDITGILDVGKAGNLTVNGKTGTALDVTATIKNFQPHLLRGALKTTLGNLRAIINGTLHLGGSPVTPVLKADLDIKTNSRPAVSLVVDGNISSTLANINVTAAGKGLKTAQVLAELPITFSLSPFTFTASDAAPLSGSAKLEGDVSGLAPLFLPAGFSMSGVAKLDASLGGTAKQPAANGSMTLFGGRLRQAGGIDLRDISLNAGFTPDKLTLRALNAKDNQGGLITLDGSIANQREYPASARMTLQKIDLSGLLATASDAATAQAVKGKMSGNLMLDGTMNRYTLKGDLTSPQIDFAIPERFGDSVPQLNIVERRGQKSATPALSNILLDIALNLPEHIFVRGWGLDAEFGGALSVGGTAEEPLVEGSLDLLRGRYEEFGRRLTLSKATLDFRGAVPPSPYLDVLAETRVDDTTVQVRLGGNIDAPKINFTAIPPMPEDEALSRLLFGRNLAAISPAQGLQLAQTLRRFSGQGGGIDPLGLLRAGIGLDDLDIESDDEGGASVGAGKYLAKDVYLEVQSGTARKSGGAKLRIDLAPNVKFESRVGQDSGSGGGIFWEREY